MARQIKMLRPDSKGRVTLGHLADGVSGFAISVDKHNRIILEPYIEVAAHEKWLFDDKAALKQVRQGLKDAAEGRVSERGSFSKYINNNTE